MAYTVRPPPQRSVWDRVDLLSLLKSYGIAGGLQDFKSKDAHQNLKKIDGNVKNYRSINDYSYLFRGYGMTVAVFYPFGAFCAMWPGCGTIGVMLFFPNWNT